MAHASKAPPVSPRRRALLGKVHVAKKELRLTEEAYRDRLFKVTGHSSAANCSDEQLVRLLDDFRDVLNWQAKPTLRQAQGKRPGGKRADHPTARKARALWISLGQLGAIDNASEQALEEFAKRQLGCARLQWADQGQMDRVIEALIAIGRRHGWDAKHKSVAVIKGRLIEAIFARLREKEFVGASWSLGEAVERIAGLTPASPAFPNWWEPGQQDAVIGHFAHLLKTGHRDGFGED